jgi:AraC family transcriptional activator of pobA
MKDIPLRRISITSNEPNLSENFRIRDIHDLLKGKEMIQELHRHDFFYILALEKGRGNHEIDFTTYKIQDRSVFFMRPGQVHQLNLKAESRGYLIEFKTDFYSTHNNGSDQLLRRSSSVNQYRFNERSFKKLTITLDSVFREHKNREEKYYAAIKANLDVFFIELVRQHKAPSDQVSEYVQERLEDFFSLLATHISNDRQVSFYANKLNLSLYQLNAITNSTLGKTSSEVINEYIVLESKRYLLATSNQVNQIAYRLGYEDVSYFIRFFKKQTGYTPDAFRQNFK